MYYNPSYPQYGQTPPAAYESLNTLGAPAPVYLILIIGMVLFMASNAMPALTPDPDQIGSAGLYHIRCDADVQQPRAFCAAVGLCAYHLRAHGADDGRSSRRTTAACYVCSPDCGISHVSDRTSTGPSMTPASS